MYTSVQGIALRGLEGFVVGVEADIQPGLPSFDIVGLPASSIRESRERVRSALLNSGLQWPRKRVLVSLTPADWRKDSTGLDLPIAVAVLVASEQLPPVSAQMILLGELALDGSLRSFRGGFTAIHHACEREAHTIIIPADEDGSAFPSAQIRRAASLLHVIDILLGRACYPLPAVSNEWLQSHTAEAAPSVDMNEVNGQQVAKRALEIAAVGGHHILLTGPPGAGKSMLAERFSTIFPPLTESEALDVKRIYSLAGIQPPNYPIRPYRAPHHTISPSGLLGGGSQPRPGEVSLAHNGILFLDEFPEFPRTALEGLRQPLETRQITVSRSAYSCTFPCLFQLIAAMNPCPCGYYGSGASRCACDPRHIARYRAKLSGPMIDRIDMTVWIDPLTIEQFTHTERREETSAEIRGRVTDAREFRAEQQSRAPSTGARTPSELLAVYNLTSPARDILFKTAEQLLFSTRSLIKIVRVARSAADLERSISVHPHHVAEALQYRFYQ